MASRSNRRRANALVWIVVVILVVVCILLPMDCTPDYYSKEITQGGQLHSIKVAIDMFVANSGYDNYPPSNDNSLPPVHPEDATPYGGAQKLAEALVGWDVLGYHPDSAFRSNGTSEDNLGVQYLVYDPTTRVNIEERQGPYIELENANPFKLGDIYEPSVLESAGVDPDNYVLCDVFARKRHSGRNTGMPILYYRADTSKTGHDVDDPDSPENIYNYKDNHILLGLGVPGKPDADHPMFADPKLFYEMARNYQVTTVSRPYRSGSYILISAGEDGLYGTDDDIRNFTKE